jgi:predicted TIM-barrel fold metal-dependent hydrolase
MGRARRERTPQAGLAEGGVVMDRAIVVSADGHASMPERCWAEYLEQDYHAYLPQLIAENELSSRVLWMLQDVRLSEDAMEVFDKEGLYADGRWRGIDDLQVRIEEMDREGVAAELVYFGDFRTQDLFFNVMNGRYPLDVVDAGVRAYDRWASDTFGSANDRLLLSGGVGTVSDVPATIAELEWIAERGFVGTYAPGFVAYPHLPPLYDEFWEPIWSAYADLGLTLIVHGGYGFSPGATHAEIANAVSRVKVAGGSDTDLLVDLGTGLFNDEAFFRDVRCRRAMWQMMLGGVFDRHPTLKLMMTEVRADWVPATLQQLDARYAEHRADIPAKLSPSEYWQRNCMAGVSFMHKGEVEIAHEIGIDTIDFGRDYPHGESTWPNTNDYWKIIFAGADKADVRKILGENAIRFLDLDRQHLASIAANIGPDLDAITDPAAVVDPALVEHLEMRCGVLKANEGDGLQEKLAPMIAEDLAAVGAA